MTDTAIPRDHNIVSKENEKVNKYIGVASVSRTEDQACDATQSIH